MGWGDGGGLVLIFLDNVLVAGRGRTRVHTQARGAVDALQRRWRAYPAQKYSRASNTLGVARQGRQLGGGGGLLADGGECLGGVVGLLPALVRGRMQCEEGAAVLVPRTMDLPAFSWTPNPRFKTFSPIRCIRNFRVLELSNKDSHTSRSCDNRARATTCKKSASRGPWPPHDPTQGN